MPTVETQINISLPDGSKKSVNQGSTAFDLAAGIADGLKRRAVGALINGVTLNLAPFIPELLKDYAYTIKPIAFSVSPKVPDQKVMEHIIKSTLSETPLSVFLKGGL